ncbi:cytochrome b/b6 domain-containing protein [Tropicimonas sp. IMCC6043]|uniref:cytochrome b/b6 domain-containing protein n=1 Tax=Tropicimonas sp. IMCC6043 TaxID=2510645 RepID=UPI00101C609A|nr:cytochrome b/b6 domain-containing protein [Tropicimonas sp. IMCC6043]RYH08958.1 cytochrome B [Tropicimonas sp. IMCC6043]
MTGRSPEADKLRRVRLWDPLVRSFHWLLVICVCTAWYLGEFGPGIMTLHFYFGYAIIALLAIRIIWGFIGAWPARFQHFVYGPGTFFRYLSGIGKRRPSLWPGHNPVGALSVFLLLGVLGLQAFTGLFADPDDFINRGPLANSVPGMVGWATSIHQVLPPIILLLVLLHLAAIVFYKVYKNENLVPSMLHGRKIVRGAVPADRIIEELPE